MARFRRKGIFFLSISSNYVYTPQQPCGEWFATLADQALEVAVIWISKLRRVLSEVFVTYAIRSLSIAAAGMSGCLLYGQTYVIVNLQSGKVLDVTGGSAAQAYPNGALIQQWDWIGGANQQWQLSGTGNNYNAIFNLQSGRVLDVTGGPTAQAYQNGAPIQQWDWLGGANQQWQVAPVGNGYSLIVNLQSGKVLDVTGGSTSQAYQNGTPVQQWDWLGGANQQWQLIQVADNGGYGPIPAPPPPINSIYSFTSSSSGILYPPSSSQGAYVICTYSDGTPIQGCGISLYMGYATYSNAHLHDSSNHPYSSVSPTYGYTDANGNLSVTIQTTLIGQTEYAFAQSDVSPGTSGFDFAVGYGDLVYGDIPGLWVRIGGTDTNASVANHGTTDNNRYMTMGAYTNLYYATVSYLRSHRPQASVCINDAALPGGGKFDIYATWTNPHAEHDRGSAVDVATSTSQTGCPSNLWVDANTFLTACRVAQAVFYQPEPGHVHCNWQNKATYPH